MNDQNERNEQEEPVNENQENQQEEPREEEQTPPAEGQSAPAVPPVASAPKRDFRKELTEFFEEHNPKRVKHVTRIAEKFRGREDIVMNHLKAQYSGGNEPEKRKKDYAAAAEARAARKGKKEKAAKGKAGKKGATGDQPKSKKKLIMLIIIGVVVMGLAVAGYMFKDKIMELVGMGTHTEEPIPDDGSTPGEPVAEEPAEPVVEEPVVIADSAAVDSTAVDTTQTE